MNRKMKTAMITACLGLATALIGYGNLTREDGGNFLTGTNQEINNLASDVAKDILAKPDEYQNLQIGMTDAEVASIHYKLMGYKVKNSSTAIPDGVEVYESRFKRQVVINPDEKTDSESIPVYFKITWAFEINEAGEQSLIAKRIYSNAVIMPNSPGDSECFPVSSFLCGETIASRM